MRILFYGDSNTYGYDPRGPVTGRYDENKIWTGRLGELLGSEYEIINEGMNGRCLPSRDFEISYLMETIKMHEPIDLLAIMLGTNDYLKGKPSIEVVKTRLENLIIELQKNCGELKLLIMTPPPIETAHIEYMEQYDTMDGTFSRAYAEVTEKLQVPLFSGAAEDIELAYDGVHLTEKGHETLAERLCGYIKGE